jgi:catechol 2,3-dioxygenase-like lactoylglutathione lyase family enzyme
MRIRRLTLPSTDLVRLADFYEHDLGLTVWRHAASIDIEVGVSVLSFQEGPTHEPVHFAFNIPPNQFGAAKEWLQQRTNLHCDKAGKDQFVFESWQADAVYFRDPDGNIAELIARRELPDADSEVFSPEQMMSISEVAIVVDDVDQSVRELDIPTYGEFTSDFAALGDPEGLLIVVRKGREFFPDSGVEAAVVPITLTIEEEGEQRDLAFGQ